MNYPERDYTWLARWQSWALVAAMFVAICVLPIAIVIGLGL